MPFGYSQPLQSIGPPFDPWIAPAELTGEHRLVIDPPYDPLYTPDRTSSRSRSDPTFLMLTKGGRSFCSWRPWEIIGVVYLLSILFTFVSKTLAFV